MEKAGKDQVKLYALVVYPSADGVATLPPRLAADEEYRKAAGEYLAAPANEPVYARIDSSLLAPIAGMPKLEKPDPSKPRLLNLRVYEKPQRARRPQEDRDVQQGGAGHLPPRRARRRSSSARRSSVPPCRT